MLGFSVRLRFIKKKVREKLIEAFVDILLPDFVDHIYVSDQKDEMEMLK